MNSRHRKFSILSFHLVSLDEGIFRENLVFNQIATEYTYLKNETAVVFEHLEAEALVLKNTHYIIDGQTPSLSSSCITLLISSPRSNEYEEFVRQKIEKMLLSRLDFGRVTESSKPILSGFIH